MRRSKISNYLLDKHSLHPLSNVSAKIPRTDAQREFYFFIKVFSFSQKWNFSPCGGAMSIVVHNFIKIHVYLLNRKILITYIYFRQVYHYAAKVLYHYSSCKHLIEKMNKTEGFLYCKVCYVSFKQNSCQKGVHFYRKMYAYLQWCWPKRSDRNARALFAKMFDPLDFTPEQTLYCSDELFLKFGMRSVEL